MMVLALLSSRFSEWPKIIEAASKSPLGIIALAMLLLSGLAYSFFKRAKQSVRASIFIAMLLALVLYGAAISRASPDDLYRVRVLVFGSDSRPADVRLVRCSLGGEPTRTEAGWLFLIPRGTVPLNGDITFYATSDDNLSSGEQSISLADEHNPPPVKISLTKKGSRISGIVEESGLDRKGLQGAIVQPVAPAADSFTTKSGGLFDFSTTAAAGEQVLLHVEAKGYKAQDIHCRAGDSTCSIFMSRR
jgi:hypothetical protein